MLKQFSIGLAVALALVLIPFTASSMIHYGTEESAPVITYQQPIHSVRGTHHSGESRNPLFAMSLWIPAFAGMMNTYVAVYK